MDVREAEIVTIAVHYCLQATPFLPSSLKFFHLIISPSSIVPKPLLQRS